MSAFRVLPFLAVALAALLPSHPARAGDAWLLGSWRVTRGQPAPWVEANSARPDTTTLLGARIEYAADRVVAPSVLGCANARYDYVAYPPDALFQGNLPAPAATAAANLGLTAATVASASVTCDTGIFEVHRATADAALLALDNVIWTLDRAPGALAADGTPEAAVQRLLEAHLGADMGFLPDLIRNKRAFLSTGLNARIDAYFAQDFPEDDVPPINGDPFTDSQEYPPLFAVGQAESGGADAARVPVRFDDGHRTRTLHFVLARENAAWRTDDIAYEHGSFNAMLALEPGE